MIQSAPMSTGRRVFLQGAALGAGLAAAQSGNRANDRINVAVAGLRGRGKDHYRAYAKIPGVRIAYLCDVDERLFPQALADVEKLAGYRPETEVDFRKVLERNSTVS